MALLKGKQDSGLKELRAGLIGAGIQKSMSPILHEQEGERLDLSYSYELMDIDMMSPDEADLERVFARCIDAGFSGVNVTYPCKQKAFSLMNVCSTEASELGAVNTVLFRDGLMFGHNTDWYGFLAALDAGLPDVSMDSVVVLGAGGAGSAVAYGLLRRKVSRLIIVDTSEQQRERLMDRLRPLAGSTELISATDAQEAIADATGVVNCTPVGMLKIPGTPIPKSYLRPSLWVADIVYVPLHTQLLKDAEATGCRTLSGAGMVVHQAAMAFELFTGVKADASKMIESFEKARRHSEV